MWEYYMRKACNIVVRWANISPQLSADRLWILTAETMGILYNFRICLPITHPLEAQIKRDCWRLPLLTGAQAALPSPANGFPLLTIWPGRPGNSILAPLPMAVVGSLECFSPTDWVVKLEKSADLPPTSHFSFFYWRNWPHGPPFGERICTLTCGRFGSF